MASHDPTPARGQEISVALVAALEHQRPPLFDPRGWFAPLIGRALADTAFRTALFRFIDCLPVLASPPAVVDHLQAYLAGADLPPALRTALHLAGGRWAAPVAAAAVRRNVRRLAAQFIAAPGPGEAGAVVARLAAAGVRVTVDLLGERTCSAVEAATHLAGYRALVAEVAGRVARGDGSISVKVSALDAHLDAVATSACVARLARGVGGLVEQAEAADLLLYLDMEDHALKGIILDLFERLADDHPQARLGCVLQAYLRESEADCARVVAIARRHPGHLSVRLVKGAYWDTEVALARQRGWPVPVFATKAETDGAFDRLAARLLGEAALLYPAIASHNADSLARALAVAEQLGLSPEAYEVQLLYGMGESLARALVGRGVRVRMYLPVGELLPGMAYFVRRLLENTANTSFLRHTYAPAMAATVARVATRAPARGSSVPAAAAVAAPLAPAPPASPAVTPPGFANEPTLDFSDGSVHAEFQEAIEQVRGELGVEVAAVVGGGDRATGDWVDSVNPAHPLQVVARFHRVTPKLVAEAASAAAAALPAWSATPAPARAALLRRAADWLAQRRHAAAAWEIFEAGKPWREADADVGEAIDFLRYYAGEAEQLGAGHRYPSPPGEQNRGRYLARGVAAVIAPWNFPLAILTGMTAAALAAGNTVCLKPASATVRVGRLLVDALIAAGLPPGCLQYLPGEGGEVGAALVAEPRVALIAFTGSRAVGLALNQQAAAVVPGQRFVKKVICEMGGKNALIVDDDADLDEAVVAILASAFGYAGQKCSACSRVIAVGSIHAPLLARLAGAVEELITGDPADPATQVGPLIDAAAQAKVEGYVALGEREGRLAARGSCPAEGYYVAPALFRAIEPHHRLAQEEVFGPVVALMAAADLEQAVATANGTDYALTGGLFSRHPGHLAYVRDHLRVGNLYLNRAITGALVGRQPFGGFGLSGIGSQAGGPDYLRQFCLPQSVCENSLRRGFAPETLE